MLRIGGRYRHVTSGNFYRIIRVSLNAKDPSKKVVAYDQLGESIMRETGKFLPVGTPWSRDYDDFIEPGKFVYDEEK